jgi:hypothetical protein
MLVARRDPFHPGAHDAVNAQGADAMSGGAPRLARTVNMLQVIGSLLAIPVGLASAYSIYRANFSAETSCQSLRANIVSMIDKSVDARTRHMLVRHDVEKFEQTCGAIDPDATVAFKTLLASDTTAAPVTAPAVRHVEAAPKEPVHKAEPHPQVAAKQPAAPPPAPVTVARREPAESDAQWLDAVRGALLAHRTERKPSDGGKTLAAPAVIPAQWPAQKNAALPAPAAAPAPVVAPAAPMAAPVAAPTVAPALPPALPPATSVAAPPAPQADPDHPVPPAAIPSPDDVAAAKAEPQHSRIGRWIAKIPLMGNVINNGWN